MDLEGKTLARKQVLKLFKHYLKQIESVVGKDTTYDDQLTALGKQLIPTYKGTYSADQIPTLKKHECCIVNTDPHNKPGEHWTALLRRDDGKLLFFDSFGRTHKIIIGLRNRKDVVDSDTKYREQKITQYDCGARSLAWLCVAYYDGYDKSKLI